MYKVSLKAARVNANLTQSQAAAALNITQRTIVSWENGKTSPSINQFEKLCKIYNVPIDNIFLNK